MSRVEDLPLEVVYRSDNDGVPVVAPADTAELSRVLAHATASGLGVGILGGGTHRDIGYVVEPDLYVATTAMAGIVDWEPDDLTVVIGAGTPVAELEETLATRGQTALLPEQPGSATVGGVVAAGISGYRRLRYGPTRDRILEVRAVTGDGRTVKGGGRVVKNVTGYDLPRLYTGSLGSLGVITSVCLKLWPLTAAAGTVRLEQLPPPGSLYRPLAVLQTPAGVRVLLAGTVEDVADQARRLEGEFTDVLDLPEPVEGECVWSLRIRPRYLADAVSRLPVAAPFVAQHGVGEITFAAAADYDVTALRAWAESTGGGALVRMRGRAASDPWGSPPPGLDLQRRIIAAFDPARVLEPGRLPGRL